MLHTPTQLSIYDTYIRSCLLDLCFMSVPQVVKVTSSYSKSQRFPSIDHSSLPLCAMIYTCTYICLYVQYFLITVHRLIFVPTISTWSDIFALLVWNLMRLIRFRKFYQIQLGVCYSWKALRWWYKFGWLVLPVCVQQVFIAIFEQKRWFIVKWCGWINHQMAHPYTGDVEYITTSTSFNSLLITNTIACKKWSMRTINQAMVGIISMLIGV